MDHGTSALRYRLLRGPVSLTPLRVLACRTFSWGGGDVRAIVLGASHAVVFRCEGREWAELLTCAAPPLADEKDNSLLIAPMPGPENSVWERPIPDRWLDGRARGVVRITRLPLPPGDSDELRGDFAPDCVLHQDFPMTNLGTPRTRIGWRTCGSALTWETVHTYPEENCGIRSETRLVLAVGGPAPERTPS